MECKCHAPGGLRYSYSVVIETLWNVNTFGLGYLDFWHSCNRDIVECKFFRFRLYVLLYWVVIETLWNVNELAVPGWARMLTGCNRDIVECKSVTCSAYSVSHPSL